MDELKSYIYDEHLYNKKSTFHKFLTVFLTVGHNILTTLMVFSGLIIPYTYAPAVITVIILVVISWYINGYTCILSDWEKSLLGIQNAKVLTIEEHVAVGGLGSSVALRLNESAIPFLRYKSIYAKGYPNNLYGSQSYHWEINGMDAKSISAAITAFFKESC